MADAQSYKIFESNEDEFHLKPCTFGLYEKVKLAQLKCTAIPNNAKDAIIREFKLSESEIGSKEEYGIKGLYEFMIKNVFLDAPQKYDVKDISINEINRAMNDFFMLASGS